MSKPRFSQTCSMLSQYLKERGSFGDLSLAMTCNNENGTSGTLCQKPPTMNLFPVYEKQSDVSSFNKLAVAEPKMAQMTIFYAGQVTVFNDFPADKAKEIMLLAGKESNHHGVASVPVNTRPVLPSTELGKTSTEPMRTVSRSPTPGFGGNSIHESLQPSPQPIASDLPIARRASLHRFLEKRKDRITAKAPYQKSNASAATETPSKETAESKSWLSLAAQSL